MMVAPALQAQSQVMNKRQKSWGKDLLLRLEAKHDQAPKNQTNFCCIIKVVVVLADFQIDYSWNDKWS